MVRDRITIPLADRVKEIRSFKAFWITSAGESELVKPIIERENVIISNNMTMEVTNEQLKKCIEVEDILVCNDIPSLYHKPGDNDCISKVALKKPLEELHQSCDWHTDSESISRASRIDETTFIIATKEESSLTVRAEKESHTYSWKKEII